MDRYMEDYVAGSVHEYGTIPVTEEEVVEFSVEVLNQRRETVMTMDTVGMGLCREKA
jgi:hypothetical protein